MYYFKAGANIFDWQLRVLVPKTSFDLGGAGTSVIINLDLNSIFYKAQVKF